MTALLVSMLAILLVAGAVVAYVAYPHRGRSIPAAPWLGDALRRGVDALPTVGEQERDAVDAAGAPGADAGSRRDDGGHGSIWHPSVPAQRRGEVTRQTHG